MVRNLVSLKFASRTLAAMIAGLLAFTLSPALGQRAAAVGESITLIACHNAGSVGDMITAKVKVSPAAATPVHGEVYVSGAWRAFDSGITDAAGNLEFELNYKRDDVGVYRYRISATFPGGIKRYTQAFNVYRAPYVALLSAPGISPAGTTITARGEARNFGSGTGFTEVLTPAGWKVSQTGSINPANGQFTLPLTYGATTPGTYKWRLGATMNGATGRSPAFTIVRTPTVELRAASTTARVGQLTTARGRTYPMKSGLTGFAQVWYGTKWATISWAETNSLGDFTAPLSYGVTTPGTYKFRLGVIVNGTRYYTKAWTVTRA